MKELIITKCQKDNERVIGGWAKVRPLHTRLKGSEKMKLRATVKYRLELLGLELKDLSKYMGLSADGLYKKLNGKLTLTEADKEKINEFLELSKIEADNLWS